jgi:hypothetical protein
MEYDAKPTLTNIVLVNDKFLMSVLGANNIKPVEILVTGWPNVSTDFIRECYMAYEQTAQVKHLIEEYKARTITVELDSYLASQEELGNNLGQMMYMPKEWEKTIHGKA